MKQDMLISRIHLKSQAKCRCFVCPILDLRIILSSCRGKRNMLIINSPLVQSKKACSQFNSNVVATALVPEYVRVICNPNEEQSS